ncbi:MAG: hypothetical protein ABIS01_16985 [Ferruginibacter sp.]
MINKLLSIILLLAGCFSVVAQAKNNGLTLSKNSQHLKVFEQAVASGDANTATIALNYYLSEQGNNDSYADTLAMLYMQQGAYPQCYYWAQKRLQLKPNDNNLQELKGICPDKLHQTIVAIDIFDKLFKKTQSPYYAHKLMELQYGIKRLAECVETALAAEKLEYRQSFIMTYNFGQQAGRTYLQAGVYNIHALALYDLDKKKEAKAYFEKALALDSSFVLARQNLEALKSMETGNPKNEPPTNNQQQQLLPAKPN